MAKNSIDAYGASGKTNVLMFEPENLHIVTDKANPLYDERIQRDQWWCGKVQDMPTLHRKWPELVLKLCPVNLAVGSNLGFSGKVQADIPKGFRG